MQCLRFCCLDTLSFDDKGDLKNFKFVVYEWHFGKPKTEASPQ